MKKLLTNLAALAIFALAGCGGGDDVDSEGAGTGSTENATATETAPPSSSIGTTIKVADAEFEGQSGRILFDGRDRAIYLFEKESSAKSECYGACAEAWLPVVTKGAPAAGGGVQPGKLGTTERTDGTTQVTYNGHPLYYYEDDPLGEVLCHNVNEFGGLWLVVDPAGNAVQ